MYTIKQLKVKQGNTKIVRQMVVNYIKYTIMCMEIKLQKKTMNKKNYVIKLN